MEKTFTYFRDLLHNQYIICLCVYFSLVSGANTCLVYIYMLIEKTDESVS